LVFTFILHFLYPVSENHCIKPPIITEYSGMDEQADLYEILIVEDDEDDIFLLARALGEVGLENSSHFFPTVKDLVDYCKHHCSPSLILLNAFPLERIYGKQ
jgi:hypothetical protein